MRAPPPEKLSIDGPAGKLEILVNEPVGERRGITLIAHPHPLFGGTMDNKVVNTLARTFTELGNLCVRCNFRGVGKSDGVYDDGRGETEDMLAVAAYARKRAGDLPVMLSGFSFGGFVQSRVAQHLAPLRMVLVAPAVGRFEVEKVPKNTLVIHGERDDVVSLADILDWARPQELPVLVLPGAGHFFHGQLHCLHDMVIAAARGWSESPTK
jgi:alpha/beta superfamily hydrolase